MQNRGEETLQEAGSPEQCVEVTQGGREVCRNLQEKLGGEVVEMAESVPASASAEEGAEAAVHWPGALGVVCWCRLREAVVHLAGGAGRQSL